MNQNSASLKNRIKSELEVTESRCFPPEGFEKVVFWRRTCWRNASMLLAETGVTGHLRISRNSRVKLLFVLFWLLECVRYTMPQIIISHYFCVLSRWQLVCRSFSFSWVIIVVWLNIKIRSKNKWEHVPFDSGRLLYRAIFIRYLWVPRHIEDKSRRRSQNAVDECFEKKLLHKKQLPKKKSCTPECRAL